MNRIFLVALFALLIPAEMKGTNCLAKDLLNPLNIDTILAAPDEYDGKRVRVSGMVHSVSPGRGRRGSEFMIIILEGSRTVPEETPRTLTVYSYTIRPYYQKGSRIIVSGIYHKAGPWAGSRREHFIEAAQITPVEVN